MNLKIMLLNQEARTKTKTKIQYILYDFASIKFSKTQTESRSVVASEVGEEITNGHRDNFLIMVVTSWVHTFVKMCQIIHFKYMNMCKLCENTINYGIVQFKWVNCTGCKLYLKKGAKCVKFIVCQPHLKKWSSQPGLLYHPQTVWPINKRIFSHIPEDGKSRIKALAGLLSGEALLPGAQMSVFLLWPYVAEGQGCSPGLFYKGTHLIHEGSTPKTYAPPKGPSS